MHAVILSQSNNYYLSLQISMNAVKEFPPVIQMPYVRIPLGPISAYANLATQEMVAHVLVSHFYRLHKHNHGSI